MEKDKHIAQGLHYLYCAQEKNGFFKSLTSQNPLELEAGNTRQTTFHASFILASLAGVKEYALARKITGSAIRFLLSEKSISWSWNYWKKSSPEYFSVRIPDDLDDTFTALAGINAWQPELLDEHAMLAATRHLIATEKTPGGPYNTWILPHFKKTDWEDIDVAVNANVMHFLSQKEVSLPGTRALIERAIIRGRFTSRYYPPFAVMYLIAKWYTGAHASKLQNALGKVGARKMNALGIACYVSSFLRLGGVPNSVKREIAFLQKSQSKDGSWPAAPFFIEQIKNGKPHWSGSATLTTALVLEALDLYARAVKKEIEKKEAAQLQKQARAITKRVQQRFAATSPAMQKVIAQMSKKIAEKDPYHEIALLSLFFARQMKSQNMPSETIVSLCAMNLFGWIGYTICDKILDGENAIAMLPAANICIREVSIILHSTLSKDDYAAACKILDTIEETNLWEHATCKLQRKGDLCAIPSTLPDYKNNIRLAEKSLGHMLGPLALVLLDAGSRKTKLARAKLIRTFFEHYLIARQLNDDAHDWLLDLENGFLNSVSVQLLAKWKGRKKILNVVHEKEALEKFFWEKTIDTISEEILLHIRRARGALKKMSFLKDTKFLEKLLLPLELSAKRAITERDATVRMLKAYKE